MKYFYGKVKRYLFFDFTFRFILESYLEKTISSLINILRPTYTEATYGDYISQGASFILLTLAVSLPFIVAIFLVRHRHELEEELFESRYGAIYEEIRVWNRIEPGQGWDLKVFHYPIFMYRRLIFIIAVFALEEHSFAQILLFVLSSFLMLVYLLHIMPFGNPVFNYLEIFNEICISIYGYILLLFTDLVELPDYLKYNLGYFLIILICFNFIANASYVSYHSIKVSIK